MLADGAPPDAVATAAGVSRRVLRGHLSHAPPSVLGARACVLAARALPALERIEGHIGELRQLAARAEAAGEYGPTVAAMREVRVCLETVAELRHELLRGVSVTVALSQRLGVPTEVEAEALIERARLAAGTTPDQAAAVAEQFLRAYWEPRGRTVQIVGRLPADGHA